MYNICPTITVITHEDYSRQLNLAATLSSRIHLDISDGSIASRKLIGLEHLSWPSNMMIDIHLMVEDPERFIDQIPDLNTNLLIMHQLNIHHLESLANRIRSKNIKVGVVIDSSQAFNDLKNYLNQIDHVMLFSGNLGYQGGAVVKLDLLKLVRKITAINNRLEIGWDGGINETNIYQLKQAGVTVFNVGSYIQSASVPKDAYDKLIAEIERQ